jgi:membrane protease YdiL (CAAX protease family)
VTDGGHGTLAPMTDERMSEPPGPTPGAPVTPALKDRVAALLEVLLCSDFPTQFALGAAFAALGFRPQNPGGGLNFAFVVALSLTDTVCLLALITVLLRSHGESPRHALLGTRPVAREARAGLPMTLVAVGIAAVVLATARTLAPWLRTVERNPLQDLMSTPGEAALFAVVVVIAGGVREEVQRAFLLRRFERYLGGPKVGLVISSTAFGLGHIVQGADAVVATALLGTFWGATYLRRRSVVAPIVSHAGFDLLQVVQFVTLGR